MPWICARRTCLIKVRLDGGIEEKLLNCAAMSIVVTAWFDKKHEKAVLGLPKGRSVHVQGKVGDVGVDKNRGEVFLSLDECMLVKRE